MNIREAYDHWSKQYDSNINKTRDLEAIALRKILSPLKFDSCLEIGCGTGKNTEWFATKTKHCVAVDLSEEMLSVAKKKINLSSVQFLQADIKKEWDFVNRKFDLVSFSLVLEHIEDLDFIFCKTSKVLVKGGFVYLGELHPFKQYSGTKARFETEEGLQTVSCFDHHISDFIQSSNKYGLEIVSINEFFDDNDRTTIPRILTLLLKKL